MSDRTYHPARRVWSFFVQLAAAHKNAIVEQQQLTGPMRPVAAFIGWLGVSFGIFLGITIGFWALFLRIFVRHGVEATTITWIFFWITFSLQQAAVFVTSLAVARGFSLPRLPVVVAIIVVLALLSLPTLFVVGTITGCNGSHFECP